MRSSLGGLYCGRNLRVRGREEAGDLFGERLIGRQSRQLALPEIEVAPRQPVEIGGSVVVFRGHARYYSRSRSKRSLRRRKACLVALRHRR
jgi:hypothetical protein